MSAKTKLELTWIGKEHRPRLEPRILIEDERFSHHATARREGDLFDNILIHGDNLLALKALEACLLFGIEIGVENTLKIGLS
jgi:adenine-specific DNA-methyltransferase